MTRATTRAVGVAVITALDAGSGGGVTTVARHMALAMLLLSAGCGGRERPATDGDAGASGSSAGVPAPAGADAGNAAASRTPIRDPVQVTVNAEVDGSRATFSGVGECQHTSDASIFQVPASLWRASADAESGALRSLHLTLWQPKESEELQVSLTVTTTGGTYAVATVKGAELQGSGSGRVEPNGAGGTMRVEGKDADGRSVRVMVECPRWTEPVAEGG